MRLTFIADIPTPYMSEALAALAGRVDLDVVYLAEGGSRGMEWTAEKPRFRSTVAGGGVIRNEGGAGTDRYPSPRVLQILRRQRPDVILSGGYGPHTFYALAYAKARHVPLLIYCDGWAQSEADLSAVQRLARTALVPRVDGFVANSVVAAARFVELGAPPERIVRAPHTTDMPRWWAVPGKESTVGGPGELRLLCVGRLVRWKGVHRAIEAVAAARAKGTEVSLKVVGTGPEEGALRRLSSRLGLDEGVRFAGFADQAELPAHFEAADAFLFPTFSDPFGVALLEAAAAGLPHVASPHGGSTLELASDGVTGFVVDPDDIDVFADRIARLAADHEGRLRMGREARARTLHRTPEYAARMYEQAARAAVARRS